MANGKRLDQVLSLLFFSSFSLFLSSLSTESLVIDIRKCLSISSQKLEVNLFQFVFPKADNETRTHVHIVYLGGDLRKCMSGEGVR